MKKNILLLIVCLMACLWLVVGCDSDKTINMSDHFGKDKSLDDSALIQSLNGDPSNVIQQDLPLVAYSIKKDMTLSEVVSLLGDRLLVYENTSSIPKYTRWQLEDGWILQIEFEKNSFLNGSEVLLTMQPLFDECSRRIITEEEKRILSVSFSNSRAVSARLYRNNGYPENVVLFESETEPSTQSEKSELKENALSERSEENELQNIPSYLDFIKDYIKLSEVVDNLGAPDFVGGSGRFIPELHIWNLEDDFRLVVYFDYSGFTDACKRAICSQLFFDEDGIRVFTNEDIKMFSDALSDRVAQKVIVIQNGKSKILFDNQTYWN